MLFDERPFFEEVFFQHILSVTEYLYQGRLFSYHDTHLHRLGTNYLQLPVNCPYKTRVCNYQRDGPQTFDNQSKSAIGCKRMQLTYCYIQLGWRSALMTWLVPSPLLNSMRHAGDGTRDVWPKGMNAKGQRINIRLRDDWGWVSISTTCSLPCSHGFLWGRRAWQSPKNLCLGARQLIMLRAGQIKYLHWRTS